MEAEEKPAIKKELSGRSPSPPVEDSEPEMTEEEKEFHLVWMICISLFLFCMLTVKRDFLNRNYLFPLSFRW